MPEEVEKREREIFAQGVVFGLLGALAMHILGGTVAVLVNMYLRCS